MHTCKQSAPPHNDKLDTQAIALQLPASQSASVCDRARIPDVGDCPGLGRRLRPPYHPSRREQHQVLTSVLGELLLEAWRQVCQRPGHALGAAVRGLKAAVGNASFAIGNGGRDCGGVGAPCRVVAEAVGMVYTNTQGGSLGNLLNSLAAKERAEVHAGSPDNVRCHEGNATMIILLYLAEALKRYRCTHLEPSPGRGKRDAPGAARSQASSEQQPAKLQACVGRTLDGQQPAAAAADAHAGLSLTQAAAGSRQHQPRQQVSADLSGHAAQRRAALSQSIGTAHGTAAFSGLYPALQRPDTDLSSSMDVTAPQPPPAQSSPAASDSEPCPTCLKRFNGWDALISHCEEGHRDAAGLGTLSGSEGVCDLTGGNTQVAGRRKKDAAGLGTLALCEHLATRRWLEEERKRGRPRHTDIGMRGQQQLEEERKTRPASAL
ncbi:MAG: hypothetical protein WDW38_002195 [Sanguina aurantia]